MLCYVLCVLRVLRCVLPTVTAHMLCLWGHYIGSRNSSFLLHNAATPFSVSEFLKKHETEFFEVVNAKLSLLKLKRIGVITEDVSSHISASTDEDAQEILYDHLMHHADVDTLRVYCDVAIAAKGHPRMQSFGEKMKGELQ